MRKRFIHNNFVVGGSSAETVGLISPMDVDRYSNLVLVVDHDQRPIQIMST